jgi:hypothetical protein
VRLQADPEGSGLFRLVVTDEFGNPRLDETGSPLPPDPALHGTLSPDPNAPDVTIYTPPPALSGNQTVRIELVNAFTDRVADGIALSLTPGSSSPPPTPRIVKTGPVQLKAGETYQIMLESPVSVTYRVKSGEGQVDPSGLYHAPDAVPAAALAVVEAVSNADPSLSDSLEITLPRPSPPAGR